MKPFLIITLFLISFLSQSQTNPYVLVDAKMNKIPQEMTSSISGIASYIQTNFKTDDEKIRAVFFWLASNISYDVENMMNDNSIYASPEKIENTLKTKKGVCIDYAEVFYSIANQLNISNRIISGFVKQNGKIESISHAWCAAKIDQKWYLFDPTWGAGFVQKGVFVKKLNNNYFKVLPSKITVTHLPFDYLWQFLDCPLTYDEFISGKTNETKDRKKFDFETEITNYEALSEIDKQQAVIKRIENNGLKCPVVVEHLAHCKSNLQVERQNASVVKLNALTDQYNQAINLLNDMIYYRNNKFKPSIPDEELDNRVKLPKEILLKCQDDAYNIGSISAENRSNLMSLKTMIANALTNSQEQYDFVQEYLKKSKIGRKLMFNKFSWSGVPLR